jgi:flagellar biogenesis protein FliO
MSLARRVSVLMTATAIGVAAAVTPMTSLADDAPAAPDKSQPNLPTRPSRPLTLAQPGPTGSWVTRVGFVVLAAGAAYAWWRRKGAKPLGTRDLARLDIVARTAVGGRSELLIVDASGTRVLIGVSAGNMQTLALLSDDDASDAASADLAIPRLRDVVDPPESRPSVASIEDRGRAFFAALRGREGTSTEEPTPAPSLTSVESASDDVTPAPRRRTARSTRAKGERAVADVEGQASGLLALKSGRR